jgi:conjugative transfer signal peptidase TraF
MNLLRRFAITSLALSAAAGAAGLAGLRVNTTHSVPPGLYWLSGRHFEVGDIVLVCPPQWPLFAEAFRRGYFGVGFCPGGYEYLFKKVLAAKNDMVSIEADGVSVNGSRVPNSAQVSADPGRRPLPAYRAESLRLSENDVLLIANHSPQSFDARYFGPVDQSHIRGVVTPLITW